MPLYSGDSRYAAADSAGSLLARLCEPNIRYPHVQEVATRLFSNTGRVGQDALHDVQRDFKRFIAGPPIPSPCN